MLALACKTHFKMRDFYVFMLLVFQIGKVEHIYRQLLTFLEFWGFFFN